MAGSEIRKATGSIREAIDRAKRAAQIIAGEAEAVATSFESTIGEGREVIKDMAAAGAEMRDAFGLGGTNGGPRVDPTTEASAPPAGAPLASPPSSGVRNEVTAIGPVHRVDG